MRERRRRRRLLVVALRLPRRDLVAHLGEGVRGGGASHPEAHAEAHVADARGVFAAHRFERAHQRRRALQLVEREQAQRVAQQHRDAVAPVGTRPPAKPSQHEREGDDAEVRLGLSSARGEEDQLDALAVGVRRVVQARDVEEQERELKQPPPGRRVLVALGVSPARLQRHRTVGEHEGREEVLVQCEEVDAFGDAVARQGRVAHELLARLASARRVERHGVLRLDPGVVRGDERRELRAERRAVGGSGERVHLGRERVEVAAHYRTHLGAREPHRARAHHAIALAQWFRRDAVADGPLDAVAVLKVGHAVVEVVGPLVAAVGAGHEARLVTKLHRDLEHEGHVAATGLCHGPAVVHHEEREGARPRGEAGRVGGREPSFEPQALGAGDLFALREPHGVELDAQAHGPSWEALPLLRRALRSIGRFFGRARQILGVVQRDLHDVSLAGRQQHRHSDRRGEQLRHLGLGRRLALLLVVAVAARGEVFVVGRVVGGARSRGREKACEVEARRRETQHLGRVGVAVEGADEVGVERVDEVRAHRDAGGRSGHGAR
ncbi:MAG: hypothetical protein U0326_09785 [Polyangiales bacterium]